MLLTPNRRLAMTMIAAFSVIASCGVQFYQLHLLHVERGHIGEKIHELQTKIQQLNDAAKNAREATERMQQVLKLMPRQEGFADEADPPGPPAHFDSSQIFQRGTRTMVRHDYYEAHPHAFDCKGDRYGCPECPVGKADRVINFTHGDYDGVPDTINVFFACAKINMLVPEPGPGVSSDEFLCQREPQDGVVAFHGRRYPCSEQDRGTKYELGDLQPGETKTITIPVPVTQNMANPAPPRAPGP